MDSENHLELRPLVSARAAYGALHLGRVSEPETQPTEDPVEESQLQVAMLLRLDSGTLSRRLLRLLLLLREKGHGGDGGAEGIDFDVGVAVVHRFGRMARELHPQFLRHAGVGQDRIEAVS